MSPPAATLRQRAEYTYRYNAGAGRHGWLRLTPAYSRRIVEETLSQYPTTRRILDPFCGTGTTALSAATRGHEAVTTDINPFLIWFTRVKTSTYSPRTASDARRLACEAIRLASESRIEPAPPPALHNISRWWSPDDLGFLTYLKAALAGLASPSDPTLDLLQVAFCRLLVRLSNVAFNHQSMSFRSSAPRLLPPSRDRGYAREVDVVLEGALEGPSGTVEVVKADATQLNPQVVRSVDVVITSPPYANRMSYVRELRPYMYWLDYLKQPRDAGELDWLAIGGTWGIATSRLTTWVANGSSSPDMLQDVLRRIRGTPKANSEVLAKYVAKYFDDMTRHFRSLPSVLRPGARLHYIVGNSVFYGVITPTEQIYAAILRERGFTDVAIRPIRKRNSKRELVEFEVSATWPGEQRAERMAG